MTEDRSSLINSLKTGFTTLNPTYGSGIFRRRVLLVNDPGRVHGALEDCSHGFQVELQHDGVQVTAVSMLAKRVPLSTCIEARHPLSAIVGCPLGISRQQYASRLPATANCTHVHDLAWWSLVHASRSEILRQYDIAVTDETALPSECTVHRNGELIHRWQAVQGRATAPTEIAGQPLLRGFAQWAGKSFEGEAYEAAVILHRGYLVAQARRHFGTKVDNYVPSEIKTLQGVCYSYSPGVVGRAVATENSQRDFTDTPELLLKFV